MSIYQNILGYKSIFLISFFLIFCFTPSPLYAEEFEAMKVEWDRIGLVNATLEKIPEGAEVRIRINQKSDRPKEKVILFAFTENNVEFRSPFGPPGVVEKIWEEFNLSDKQVLTYTLSKAMHVGIGIEFKKGVLYENSKLEKKEEHYSMTFTEGSKSWDIDVKILNKEF